MKISITIDSEAWQYALDKANSAALTATPEKQRADFVPKTLDDYVQERVSGLSASYAEQKIESLVRDKADQFRKELLAQAASLDAEAAKLAD